MTIPQPPHSIQPSDEQTRQASAPGSALSLWHAGEYGVEWSLVAIRLDPNGRELGRMIAPPRRNPRSYLRLELPAGTAEVVLALTNLSSRIPDADEPDENVRSYRLTIDRAAPIGAAPTPPGNAPAPATR